MTEPHPELTVYDQYGTAASLRHADGKVTVLHADNRIGVSAELWDRLEAPHRRDDGTLWLDTAGAYRYRFVGWGRTRLDMVFDRLAPTKGAPTA